MLKIGIIEDDLVIREGLRRYLSVDFENVIAAESVEEFLPELKDKNKDFDIILTDIELPGMNGIEGIKHIKKISPTTDILMLTVYNDSDRIFKSLCAGAIGYLLKNTPLPEIKEAIVNTHKKGGAPMSPTIARKVIEHFQPKRPVKSVLTPREREIVDAIVEGLSYKMIGNKLFISIETVRQHIKNIYRKLHVNSKAEVIAKSLKGEI